MYLLSLDTTARTASVCVSRLVEGGLTPICRISQHNTLTHSENLLPMIDFCLGNSRLLFEDIGATVVSAGPGSFTGVRIGVSTVKGLALARDLKSGRTHPCVPVSSLHALAMNLPPCEGGSVICPVMDARRQQVYNALFVSDGAGVKRLCADRVITAQALYRELCGGYPEQKIFLTGDGAELCGELFSRLGAHEDACPEVILCGEAWRYQDAFSVARAAAQRDLRLLCEPERAKEYSCERLRPVYLRASQAEREKNGGKNKC